MSIILPSVLAILACVVLSISLVAQSNVIAVTHSCEN